MTDILFPVGRLVQGTVHELKEVEDSKGAKKVGKDGKPMMQCFFSIAIAKTQADWKLEPWGQTIVQVATGAFPGGQHAWPHFAWKVIDGDSTIPNRKGKLPKDQQGFAGNWVIKMSGGFLPNLVTRDGSQRLPLEQKIELGDYVQALGYVSGNNSTESPGVYLNHRAVAFVGFGERITYERDFSSAGFGQAPVPAGVLSAPAAGMATASAALAAPALAPAAPLPAPAAPVAVPPNPAVLQAPVAPAAPLPPAPVAAKQMTAAATGTYEAYITAGWTDAQLVQHGLMVA